MKDWLKDGTQRQPVTSDIELTLITTSITAALQNLQFTELTGKKFQSFVSSSFDYFCSSECVYISNCQVH